ncbi:MAG: FHA domain-containing protein [Thermoleophilia bacterium]|nr:FHA domain-containing protein [Thermoleophilia bacterium]
MLQIVLLAGKFIFLIVLYIFIWRVVRSTTRELRAAAPAAETQRWPAAVETYAVDAEAPTAVIPGTRRSGVWTLVVQKSPCIPVATAFPFPAGTHALAGRSSDVDIQLDDTFVSAKHALFETTDAGLQVEDLRSTNGTQLNGHDISGPESLQAGDRVEVGDTLFLVEVR